MKELGKIERFIPLRRKNTMESVGYFRYVSSDKFHKLMPLKLLGIAEACLSVRIYSLTIEFG
jgi:hypothetical protein